MVISFGRTGFTNDLGPLDAPLLFCSRSSHEVTGLSFRFGGGMGVEPRELSVVLLAVKPSEDVALDDIFSLFVF